MYLLLDVLDDTPIVCPGCGEATVLAFTREGDDCAIECEWCGHPRYLWSVGFFTQEQWRILLPALNTRIVI